MNFARDLKIENDETAFSDLENWFDTIILKLKELKQTELGIGKDCNDGYFTEGLDFTRALIMSSLRTFYIINDISHFKVAVVKPIVETYIKQLKLENSLFGEASYKLIDSVDTVFRNTFD